MIPAPIIRAPYEPPTFITYQDRIRARDQALLAQANAYVPPHRLDRRDTTSSLHRNNTKRPLPKPPSTNNSPPPAAALVTNAPPAIIVESPNAAGPSRSQVPNLLEPGSSSFTVTGPRSILVTTQLQVDSAILCGGCGEPIIGRVVNAMKQRFHPDCFNCTVCHESLEHVSSFEHLGQPFCHLDYHNVRLLPSLSSPADDDRNSPTNAIIVTPQSLTPASSVLMMKSWAPGIITSFTSSARSAVTHSSTLVP